MKYNIGIIGNGFVGSAISAGFLLHVNDYGLSVDFQYILLHMFNY